MAQAEVAAQGGEQALAVVGPGFAVLLELDDVMADLPLGLGDDGVDGLMCPKLTGGIDLGDTAQQALVANIGAQLVAHGVQPIVLRWTLTLVARLASMPVRNSSQLCRRDE